MFLSLLANAQEEQLKPSELPGWKLKNFANGYQRIGDVYSAIAMLEEYLNRHPNNKKAQRQLGELYRESRDYKSALEIYEKLYQEKPDAESHYYYAQMLMRTGEYSKAEDQFNSFRAKYPETNSKYEEFYSTLNQELEGATFAAKQAPDPTISMVHLDSSINNPHIDFSPLPINDSILLYASLKSNDAYFDPADIPRRSFYMAQKTDTATYKPLPLPFNFNDPAYDCGNGVYSLTGKKFFFTKCSKPSITAKAICSIYASDFIDGQWREPRKLSQVNVDGFTTTYPTVGKDSHENEVLYFSTDRTGSVGGLDIWYAQYDDKKGTFKAPRNCGKKINTSKDEITPWYQVETKTLFFSSDGQPGFGGFDIYKSQGEIKKWNDPKNVGMPLNSPADDMFYILKPNRESGFLVSNREGGIALENATCCDDIYEFIYTDLLQIQVSGVVAEEIDTTFMPGYTKYDSLPPVPATVGLYLSVDDKYVLVEKQKIMPGDNYTFQLQKGNKYQIAAEKEGFLKDSKPLSTESVYKSDSLTLDLLTLRQIPMMPIVIKNIYYPFDKDYLTEQSQVIIDTTIYKVMTDNPDIIVEIGSHTDAMGTDEYNIDLSQRRAQSVVDYLISKGIKGDRLAAKGYGETIPLAPNINDDGSDNPEGRQKNRRTEFRVIGFLPGVSDIIYEE